MNTFKKIALMAVVAVGMSAPVQAFEPTMTTIVLGGTSVASLVAGGVAHFVKHKNAKRGDMNNKNLNRLRNLAFLLSAGSGVAALANHSYNGGKTAPVTDATAGTDAPAPGSDAPAAGSNIPAAGSNIPAATQGS